MSEKTPHRRPATFKLDDPGVVRVLDIGEEDVPGYLAMNAERLNPPENPVACPFEHE